MDTSKFFKPQNDLSFENYLKTTHNDWLKDSLASVRAILHDYVKDVKDQQRQQNHATTRLKTSYNDAELESLIERESNNDQSTIWNNYISSNTIEQLTIGQSTMMQKKGSSGQKRSRDQTPEQPSMSTPEQPSTPTPEKPSTPTSEKPSTPTSEQPSTSTRGKRNCKRITDESFVPSEIITDDDTNSDVTSSPSSFYPSDLMRTPIGYTCRIEMCELEDFFPIPLPIRNSHFAALVASAIKKSDENQLFPSDCLTRLHASAIFNTDDSFLLSDDDDNESDVLPENVYKNILAFKRAMQKRTLYIQPHTCSNLEQMALNSIITSSYLLHGKPRIESKGSEIDLVASSVSIFLSPLFSAHDQIQIKFDTTSWIFKQQDDTDNVSLRPDIIFNCQQQEEVVEVGCGEIKKPGASQALLDEDKMRVLEVMKRQLHLRLRRAKKEYEAVTFGVLAQGTTVILLTMKMDLEDGVYIYHEQQPFTLPTTYLTHSHMDTSLEVIVKFKDQMLNSLLRVEDNDCKSIWNLYKPHVRPTVISFNPIYHDQ
ncbi:hypothetical protein INT48_003996 [Thamnidium elegans]|uniref:Uncharacterized protein n=1 Tax=Thamnidium elegans TaxID=101142 RepID=A0A8H7VW35_9FUNG|nr:hypothetical protein INT48_003996 [Thamnidium elegans]